MATKRTLQLLPMVGLSLLLTSCYDSNSPLSDPQQSKPDERLLGVWRFRGEGGEMNYYHIGRGGEKLPAAVMHVVNVQHQPDGNIQRGDMLNFPTVIGHATYLNAAECDASQLKQLQETGWNAGAFDAYYILRYRAEGDRLHLQLMDGGAKRGAIEGRKVAGKIEKDNDGNEHAYFTDTPENLARFVSEASDTLFVRDGITLERVK